jgi:hypothetical protein
MIWMLIFSFSLSGLIAIVWVFAIDRAEDRRMSMIEGPHRMPRAVRRRMKKSRADLRRALRNR